MPYRLNLVGSRSISKQIDILQPLPGSDGYSSEFIIDDLPPETTLTFTGTINGALDAQNLVVAANTRYSVATITDQNGTQTTGRITSCSVEQVAGGANIYNATINIRLMDNEDESTSRVYFSFGGE